MGKHCLQPF